MNDNKSAFRSNTYDKQVPTILPYYREFHKQVIDLVRSMDIRSVKWLDTGCGTGTMAFEAMKLIPDVRFTLCDPSEKMLGEARSKLEGKDIRFLNIPSEEMNFEEEFDIVSAIQSHHYYSIKEREAAVSRCYRALKGSGIFVTFENIRMETEESDRLAVKRWVRFLEEQGHTPEEVESHLARRGVEMFPIRISQHVELLKKCGFRSVNILWMSYLQAGFWAEKGGAK